MDQPSPVERAQRFRALHDRQKLLLLPNAWDAGSARLFAELGFAAIATTSGGVAWSLGYPDGEKVPLDEVLAVARRMVRATPLPVSLDFEAGYGESPEAVAASVGAVIDAGVAGINLEDGIDHRELRALEEATARIRAARKAAERAGVPIVINARVDAWMVGGAVREADRFDVALERARSYLAAGADCVYPIGLADLATIERLVAAVGAPLNVGVRAGMPNLSELARIGVARVTCGTRLASVAYSAARDAARVLREEGRADGLEARFGYPDMQRLFTP